MKSAQVIVCTRDTGMLGVSTSRRLASASLMPSASSKCTRGSCSNVTKDRMKAVPHVPHVSPYSAQAVAPVSPHIPLHCTDIPHKLTASNRMRVLLHELSTHARVAGPGGGEPHVDVKAAVPELPGAEPGARLGWHPSLHATIHESCSIMRSMWAPHVPVWR